MRIISGNRRGLKLKAPKGLDTRPTEDRVKESVFNILGQNFFDDLVLDLFCGSGANGIEFISRGAKKAYFVDKSKEAMDCVKYRARSTSIAGFWPSKRSSSLNTRLWDSR